MRVHPFRDGDAFSAFRNITEKVTREIEALENDYVLKASPAELERHYVSQVTVTPLALDAKNHYIDSEKGTQLDVSHDFRRGGGLGLGRLVVKGTSIDIAIPFTGDPGLWRIQPSSFSVSGYPELEIRDDVVVWVEGLDDVSMRTIRRRRRRNAADHRGSRPQEASPSCVIFSSPKTFTHSLNAKFPGGAANDPGLRGHTHDPKGTGEVGERFGRSATDSVPPQAV